MGKNGIKVLMAIFGFICFFMSRLNAYNITLNSNGGSEVQPPQISGGIILNIPDDPKLANHMFLGWFDENGKRFTFVGTELSGNIQLEARWSDFSDIGYYGVIDGQPISIVMMDRNLGATTNDVSKTGSYGYYYQWGNNHGFLPIGESTSSVPLSGDGFGPGNWFVGENFIKSGNDWSNSRNDNLWGGGGDNSSNLYDNLNDRTQRQGPCPDGYHIPSLREWNTLFDLFLVNNGVSGVNNFPSAVGQKVKAAFAVNSDDLTAFLNQLKIPFAGRVKGGYEYDRYDGYTSGKYAYFWSSTPLGKDSLLAEVNNNSGVINVGGWPNTRAQGIPIRCFKNQSEVGGQAYMFDANGGYFSGGLTGKIEYYMNGISLNPNILLIPEKEGYSFDGWYTQAEGGDKIELHQVSGSKQLYAHWVVSGEIVPIEDETSEDVVQDLDIYFVVNDSGTSHYTLMDRNLGAISNDISSTGSYGYQYQWGNNHGFLSCGTDGCGTFPGGEGDPISTLVINATDYGPGNYYSGNVFIKNSSTPYDWANPQNDNLWGDVTDESGDNPSARQGPCDTGYHVPSSAEWLDIQNAWLGVNNGNPNKCTGTNNKVETNACAAKIQADLLLPNVGRRNHTDGKVGYKQAASYWTSSPSGTQGDGFYYNSQETTASNSLKFSPENRARARSVRCVKDVYNTPITINIGGGTKAAVSVYEGKLHYLTDPAKSGYSFGGWYSNLTGNIKIEDGGKINSGVTVLYAKWIASDEYEYSFYASGGIFLSTSNDQFVQIYKDGSGVDLSNVELPIRTGFEFVGWYDKNMENEYTGSLIVSGNLDLYAKWTAKTYTITWKDGDGNTLKTEQIEYGVIPVYSGVDPTKTDTAQTGYTFNNTREPTIEEVTGDATYTAQFDETTNKYTITWKDGDGNTLKTEQIEYGAIPVYSGADPTKTDTVQTGYTFNNTREPVITAVTGDAVYIAQFDETTNTYTITWKDGDGNTLKTEQIEYGAIPVYSGADPTKTDTAQTGYTFNNTREPVITAVTGDAVYIAQFDETRIEYIIKFVDWDGTELSTSGYYYGETVLEPADPSRDSDGTYTYEFDDWIPSVTIVTESQVYTATYTQTLVERNTSDVSNTLRKDKCPNGDFSDSYYDGTCVGPHDNEDSGGYEGADVSKGSTYSDELQQAYERAYENGITTMGNINDANVYGELSRIEMAKMLSKYAINVLGKTVEGIGNILFDDVDSELDNKYDNGVSISSEMEVMGVNMPNNKFRPFDLVPRSEFVTAFSRMKYGTADGEDVYYSTHMDVMKNEGIITKTDPNMMELVGYVMIMLMRSMK